MHLSEILTHRIITIFNLENFVKNIHESSVRKIDHSLFHSFRQLLLSSRFVRRIL